jgi:hypothetical protein
MGDHVRVEPDQIVVRAPEGLNPCTLAHIVVDRVQERIGHDVDYLLEAEPADRIADGFDRLRSDMYRLASEDDTLQALAELLLSVEWFCWALAGAGAVPVVEALRVSRANQGIADEATTAGRSAVGQT